MSGSKLGSGRGRDKDFAWYKRELDARLGPLQQASGGAAFGHSHVVRAHGAEFAAELTDEAIAEVLEHVGKSPDPNYRRFLGQLKAEQTRRQAERDRHTTLLVRWTLLFAAVGAAAAAAPLLFEWLQLAG